MNETGLRNLFNKYLTADSAWLTVEDCVRMVIVDARLKFSRKQIVWAFSMSKQTVANECDDKSSQEYFKLPFVEFLEFIARLVDIQFSDSELADMPLAEKLEHILKDLLALVKYEIKYNRVVIEEFSDSDDDY